MESAARSDALKLLMEMLPIPALSGKEMAAAAFVARKLKQAGASPKSIAHDNAHKKSPLHGEVGNLIFMLPGTVPGPRRLLMAHLDTVPICVGTKPVRDGEYIRSGNPKTGLGGDNRTGCCAILNAALLILKKRLPHPPLTFLWCVQEEVGLYGARFSDTQKLGNPRLCFNWDSSKPECIIAGATGAYRMTIRITGLASHAGVAPQKGVSAIAIAGIAIADLHKNGWHGLVKRNGKRGTSNIGIISGGDATNVVTDSVFLKAEARSHDRVFRKKIMLEIKAAFERAVKAVRNAEGAKGKLGFEADLHYESFRLGDSAPVVREAQRAIRVLGMKPDTKVTDGGLDANWLSARGLPTVTLGAGQENVHTLAERAHVESYLRGCEVALELATAANRAQP